MILVPYFICCYLHCHCRGLLAHFALLRPHNSACARPAVGVVVSLLARNDVLIVAAVYQVCTVVKYSRSKENIWEIFFNKNGWSQLLCSASLWLTYWATTCFATTWWEAGVDLGGGVHWRLFSVRSLITVLWFLTSLQLYSITNS